MNWLGRQQQSSYHKQENTGVFNGEIEEKDNPSHKEKYCPCDPKDIPKHIPMLLSLLISGGLVSYGVFQLACYTHQIESGIQKIATGVALILPFIHNPQGVEEPKNKESKGPNYPLY